MDSSFLLFIQIGALIAQVLVIVKGYSWIMEKLDKKINERIELNPVLRDYNLIQYRITELEPHVKDIRREISEINLILAKLDEK